MSTPKPNIEAVPALELRRDLGMWAAMAIVVGTVIGSGIFRVPQAMVERTGSPEMVFAVWIFGGILSLFGALTYAELAAALPGAGGEYVYLKAAYGPFFGFLYGWTQTTVAKAASVATLSTAFFDYAGTFRPQLAAPVFTVPWKIGPAGTDFSVSEGQIGAMALILGLGFVNYFGVKIGGGLQVVITGLKVAAILAIIAVGMTASQGNSANYFTSTPSAGGFAGFMAALVGALWAYDGWNNVGMVASEIKKPQRNLPISLIGGTLAVIAIYLATNVAYFYVLSAEQVSKSPRVAAEMMRVVAGPAGASLVSVAVMISIFAALNGSILAGSRVPFAIAKDGLFFSGVSYVHPVYGTPSRAIVVLSVWSAVLVLTGRYEQLYTLVIFPSWILYAMATASVLVLRRTRPDLPRPYRTLGYPVVPVLFVLVAMTLIVATLLESPRESLLGLILIILGLPFYWHWKRKTVID